MGDLQLPGVHLDMTYNSHRDTKKGVTPSHIPSVHCACTIAMCITSVRLFICTSVHVSIVMCITSVRLFICTCVCMFMC